MGLEYVDIFYSHRVDEIRRWKKPPLRWLMRYKAVRRVCRDLLLLARADAKNGRVAAEWKIPLLIHQPSYNLLNRWGIKAACWIPCKITAWAALPLSTGSGIADRKISQRYSARFTMHREGNKVRGLTPKMLTEATSTACAYCMKWHSSVDNQWRNGVKLVAER